MRGVKERKKSERQRREEWGRGEGKEKIQKREKERTERKVKQGERKRDKRGVRERRGGK